MEVMIDTSYLIDLVKKRGLSEFIKKYDKVYISEITLFEFIRGEMFLGKEKAVKAKIILENLFEVIKLNNEILLKASEIYYNLKKERKLIEDANLLIGATAIVYNLPLLTLNKKHFERLAPFGLKLL